MKRSASVRKPDVSVLMPCFNGDQWLPEAIESVLSQTFQNYELILVDDGSTDSTLDIVRRYSDLDGRIVAIAKPHTDVSDSLNAGLAKANGTWVARLDQDDLCAPTRLSEQISFVSDHPDTVFLGSAYIRIDEHGREVSQHGFPASHRRLMVNLERLKGFCPHSTAFFRLDLAKKVGGYRACLNNANDHDLWLRLASHGKLACLSAPLVQCRGHSRQMSHDGAGEPQLVEGVAGSACHFLRKLGSQDPLEQGNPSRVIEFLDFVRHGVRKSGLIVRRGVWGEARSEYFKRSNILSGALVFFSVLIRSGHARKLLWEKCFGLSLPQELAKEWIRKAGYQKWSQEIGQPD